MQERLTYYQRFLPGLEQEMPEEFFKLAQILELNMFELLFLEEEYKIVYLMNDGAESFLVFQNARITGNYESDSAVEIQAKLERRETGYALIVYQGNDNVFTIYFDALRMENHFFDYGKLGHFWIKGYEYLRWMEYQLAVIKDKYRYLGKESCTEKERILASVAFFPPIREYPSVPLKYRVIEQPVLEQQAITYLADLAEKVGDVSMKKALLRYGERPSRWREKKVSYMLRWKKHGDFVERLMREIQAAGEVYPMREFEPEEKKQYERLLEKAEDALEEERKNGNSAMIFREEPFFYARDAVTFQVHLMIWKDGIWNRRVRMRTFQD